MSQILVYSNKTSSAFFDSIVDLELKICHILHIETNLNIHQQINNDIDYLKVIQQTIKKIYHHLLKNISRSIQGSHNFLKSQQVQENQVKGSQYDRIEDLLQKEQSKNRQLIKKQLQNREHHNEIIDELDSQKILNQKLNFQINKLTEQLQDKTIQIMHLKNQTKNYQRTMNSKSNKNGKYDYVLNNDPTFEPMSHSLQEQRNQASSRQKLNGINNEKNMKEIKQQALYALYNSHKKQLLDTFNLPISQRKKKTSLTNNNLNKKTLQKNVHPPLNSQKKTHSRRKSQELHKKASVQKDIPQTSKKKKSKKSPKINNILY